jgi:phosphohistidine phosphatase
VATIILLRHGDAEPDSGSGDAARPLTDRGREQAAAAGRALAELGLIPEACLTSPKKRALQTAELACEGLGLTPVVEEALAGPDHRAEVLASGWASVLLVGHEPMMSAETSRLTGANVKFRKGGLAVIIGTRLNLLAGSDLIGLASGDRSADGT